MAFEEEFEVSKRAQIKERLQMPEKFNSIWLMCTCTPQCKAAKWSAEFKHGQRSLQNDT